MTSESFVIAQILNLKQEYSQICKRQYDPKYAFSRVKKLDRDSKSRLMEIVKTVEMFKENLSKGLHSWPDRL